MEWPWPERKATTPVVTWGGCHRRPPGGRRWASSTPTPLPRCMFPWSAPSAETRLTRLRGLRSETGLGASTGARRRRRAGSSPVVTRRNETADVDRRRTRPGSGQATTTPGVPLSPQHSRDERMAGVRGARTQNPKKHELSFCCQRILRAALVWCIDRAVGVRNGKPRKPVRPVRNTGSKRSSHAVFGAKQATGLLIKPCSTSS